MHKHASTASLIAGNEFCAVATYNYSIGGAWGWDDRRCDEKHIFMCRLMRGQRRSALPAANPCMVLLIAGCQFLLS